MEYKLQLKRLRQAAGLTQAELADRSGIKIGTLRTWEQKGTPATPRLDDAVALCEVLGCTPNDLCGWYDAHPEDRPAPKPELDHDERVLLDHYRECGPVERDTAQTVLRSLGASSNASNATSTASDEREA